MERSEIEVRSTAGRQEGREPATEMKRSEIEVRSTAVGLTQNVPGHRI